MPLKNKEVLQLPPPAPLTDNPRFVVLSNVLFIAFVQHHNFF